MKITSTVEGTADAKRFGRDHAKAAVLAIAGLSLLITARSMPWVAVQRGEFAVDRMFGRAPSTEVRTYVLTDLAGYWQPLYVGWALLVGLVVAVWVRPSWRFGLGLAAMLLGVVLGVGTLLPATAAIDVSGFPLKDGPSTDLLGGVWSALFGVVLLVRAVTALPEPSTPAAPEATPVVPVDEPVATDLPAAADSTPFVWQGSRRNDRPAAPWWRRPGPIVGLVAGLATAAVLVTVIWHATRPAPVDQHAGLGALVVVAPAGSTPVAPAAVDDQVDLGRILPLTRERTFLLAEQTSGGVLHVAGSAWTRPDGASVSITLLRFSSVESADQFRRTYADLERATPGEATQFADVPGATIFVAAEQTGVWALAGRDAVVMVVSAVGGSSNTVPVVESLVREQYGRL
ncbi:hypothetical protein V6V47_10680 [Micromonospora sp. CPCC 205539]|uniref:hypothetical protein n=1 Tax=Micromonospora sp. CPCC 205539 TaxID=3122408 RepID=UPI002FF3233D